MRSTNLILENHLPNICNTIPESTEHLTSQLNKYGYILIRTNQPLNENKIIDLLKIIDLMY